MPKKKNKQPGFWKTVFTVIIIIYLIETVTVIALAAGHEYS